MRALMAVLLLVPALATAQSSSQDPPRGTPSLPPIGLPLAPIGLPLPPIGLQNPPGGTPTASPRSGPERRTTAPNPNGGGRHRPGRVGPPVILVAPYYWSTAPPAGTPTVSAPTAPTAVETTTPAPTGTVWLEVEPRGVGEVYVDDYLVGTASELRGQVTVDPGPHRVEVRAPNYELLRADVRVEAGGAVTLHRTLQAASPPAAAVSTREASAAHEASPPVPRKTFYFIPGCYLGDVPPTDARLPSGCDLTKTVVVPPK